MQAIIFISSLLFLANSYPNHAVYLSVLEMDQEQMKIKVFTDNLQDAIRSDAESFTPSGKQTFPETNKSAIEAYFQKKILLRINGKAIGFYLEETTIEGDSYWVTLTLETHEKWEVCHLEASYFMELFPDQTNVVKVISESPQFFKLTKQHPGCSFKV